MTEEKLSTNDESLTVDYGQLTDENDDHLTTDKNPATKDRIKLGKKRKKLLHLEVWKHFTKLNSKFALCRHCQRVISYISTTRSLLRHLQSKHPSVLAKEENRNDLEKTNEEVGNNEFIHERFAKTTGQHTDFRRKRPPLVQGKKRRSVVWNYFLESSDKSGISCKICKCKFSYQTSTSQLQMHRLRVHLHPKTNSVPAKKHRKLPENSLEEINEDTDIHSAYKGFIGKGKEQYYAGKRNPTFWNFFRRCENDQISCNACNCKYSNKTSTSNLITHLIRAHPVPETNLVTSKSPKKPISDSESDHSDVPDNFEPPDYHLNANYKRQQDQQQTDSMVENQVSETPTIEVKLENDISEKDSIADEEMDSRDSENLEENRVEGRIQIKEEIMSEEEEMNAAEEQLNLKEEYASSPDDNLIRPDKQVRLVEFLVPALNSEKYGKLLFWGHEPNVFYIKWRHKSNREFSPMELVVFEDWDALKGRTKAKSDFDVVYTRMRLFNALKTQVRTLKSELKGYKKFQMLNTTDHIDKNELQKQNCLRKQKNSRKEESQDLSYKNWHVRTEAESKDRFSRTRGSISYKEASDHEEEDGEEEKIPFTPHSRNSKNKSSPTKSLLRDTINAKFSSKVNKKHNNECAKPIPNPTFHSSKAPEPPTSSTEKRSEDINLITESCGQKLKLKTDTKDKVKALLYQVPALTSPMIAKKEDNKPKVSDTFTNVKTQGDMVVAMIKTALPTLQSDKVSEVYNFLVEMGVENVEDLAFIEVNDLNKILKPVQSRKLIAAWKNKGGSIYSNVPNPTCVPGPVTFVPAIFQMQNMS
ncbi:hypothetical protein JTE90_026793 [Oedothorax gibbosus]|uniref:BED-type domain-containing protein n=1 Tax=Oedothorax gibbosus TaxID=931172 RepID=A0AAV6UQC8_9ARAC|nr:hypothetical protein JTE90_026793 [Oedothorax gibbosus]